MTAGLIRSFMICALVLVVSSAALSGERSDPLAKKLAEFKGAERGEVIPIAEKALERAFPGDLFYVLRFRQYPVAMAPPDSLRSNNLFVERPGGSVTYIPDVGALEKFFRTSLSLVKTEADAKGAAKSWLRLVQEFYQDGFFQFSVSDDSLGVAKVAGGALKVTGKAVVDQHGGNSGEIAASLTFDRTGKLAKASETARVNAGVRPICQATKLLDPDPIVRGMAEQAILIMGKAAKGYLDEQRAKANPELQQAIDRVWQRILIEER